MSKKLSDCWQTPQWLFDELNEEFSFDIDLCATKENNKCPFFYSNYLKDTPATAVHVFSKESFKRHAERLGLKSAFMNPPYSNPKPFIEKAWEDSKHCKIVCLVKYDPSTKWWATFWNYEDVLECWSCSSKFKEPFDIYRIYECLHCGGGSINLHLIGPKPGCEVRFFSKRIKFVAPKGLNGSSGPTFPCALVIMDRRYLK